MKIPFEIYEVSVWSETIDEHKDIVSERTFQKLFSEPDDAIGEAIKQRDILEEALEDKDYIFLVNKEPDCFRGFTYIVKDWSAKYCVRILKLTVN